MNKILLAFTISLSFLMLGCEKYPEPAVDTGERINLQAIYSINQKDLDKIAKNLLVSYRAIDLLSADKCPIATPITACVEVELSFTAKQAIAAKNWTIYFSHSNPITSYTSNTFTIKHLNGGLHQISLKDIFSGFSNGDRKTINFATPLSRSSDFDVMPNFLIDGNNLEPRVIKSTVPYIDKSTGLEVLPHAEQFSKKLKVKMQQDRDSQSNVLMSEMLNQKATLTLDDEVALIRSIIPTPKSQRFDPNIGFADLSKGIHFSLGNVLHSDVEAAISRLKALGIKENPAGLPLHLSIEKNFSNVKGAYHLSITEEGITIIGADSNGAFNGLQSLAGLLTLDDSRLAVMVVNDEPHYEYRGLFIDVARNFHSKNFILKLLDQMAAYKLNKLQLHLGDDEGWRIEIPDLPELTDVGSKRCLDFSEELCLLPMLGAGNNERSKINGYYTVEDYQEILRAAKVRHIDVIPSFNMLNHSRAAIKSMNARYHKFQSLNEDRKANEFLLADPSLTTSNHSGQKSDSHGYYDSALNPCLDSTYHFISVVMQQLKQIYASADQKLTRVKTGVNQLTNPVTPLAVQSECNTFMAEHGITDATKLGQFFSKKIMHDNNSIGIQEITADLLSFNLTKSQAVNELSSFWLSMHDEQTRSDSLGIQAELWSENLRTDSMVEHTLFPRLIALAQRAWHQPKFIENTTVSEMNAQQQNAHAEQQSKILNRQWKSFANTLARKELAKLELSNVYYQLPNAVAFIQNGLLHAKSELPGLPIEYQTNDGAWLIYQQPIPMVGTIKVRSISHNGLRKGSIRQVSITK